ncbi:MAG: penicillin-binding protein 2 [Dehalococcoidia bacterium]|nr:penicillin-binding protein 2 [Dehalococcoidia bacterium]
MLHDPRDPRRWSPHASSAERERVGNSRRKRNLWLFRVTVLVLFGILLVQLFRMQIIQGASYDQRARENRIITRITLPQRGIIFSRDGTPLVANEPVYSAILVPSEIPLAEEDDVALALEQLLTVPRGMLKQIIADGKASFNDYDSRTIADNVSRDAALMLRQLHTRWPGVDVVVSARRFYTQGSLLGNILGYVGPVTAEEYADLKSNGYRVSDKIGKTGLESQYETLLRGEIGYTQSEVDGSGNEVRRLREQAPQSAHGIVLTIDLDLQRQVDKVLQENKGKSKNLVAIIMDVRTGEILAMSSFPSYDPNVFGDPKRSKDIQALLDDPGRPMFNHATAGAYPPGSIFKQVTGLAALQEGIAKPDTKIESKGYLQVLNDRNEFVTNMLDWSRLGVLDFAHAVALSSDVYFYYLAGGYRPANFPGLGPDRLAQYSRAFGLGAPTGIDLPDESEGLVPDPRWKERVVGEPWVLGDSYNFGIGQGFLLTTPIQMLAVTAAIANDGVRMRPHLVRQIVDDKRRVVAEPVERVRGYLPLSAENLKLMRDAMRLAITAGTASPATVRGVAVAGKTGTAEFGRQLPDGTYETTHGWFTGFAPAENPQIAIVTFVEHGGGNQEAAPLAQKILNYYFNRDTGVEPVSTPRADVRIERRGQLELGPGDVPSTPSTGAGR